MAEQSRDGGRPVRKTCGNCTHYRNEKVDGTRIGQSGSRIGECWWGPPCVVPALAPGPGGQPVLQIQSYWPPVSADSHPCHRWVDVKEIPDPLADEPAESMPLPAPATPES